MSTALVPLDVAIEDADFEEVSLARAARGETLPVVPQADSDTTLIETWVKRSNSEHTRRKYRAEAARLLAFTGKPLVLILIGDLQAYLASLEDKAPATRANAAAAMKSLFSFAQEIGYVRFNIGKAIKAPPVKNVLAERILTESDTQRMVLLEPNLRNRTVLTVLYGGGLRISELCGLRWRDMAERDQAGQVTVFGKSGKTRIVLLSVGTWKLLATLRAELPGPPKPDASVFVSRQSGSLDASQVHRIVKAAAARAGLSVEVSAHWLRHAHASHALDRGAPVHLVQQTLGHASLATTTKYTHARPSESSSRFLGI
ncbi:tyrosine-type recombinase/integrase [Methylobacterium sp. J-088]|uniref:tyrosine-type recombinase/integrase n=1 Tax=Methylobacterium sp. J-088 TaxID=2836664 RepID=UPI001FBAAA1A|nr:tyrosine-type recombinase/integrase [Methylobacterium sp. J-088]MCJ2065863.1 tyrosine-type recombinase/integrase [Methylobacterium sp. J-088]